MALFIAFDPSTGAASITLPENLPGDRTLRLALQDGRTRRYLTETGWSNSRKILAEVAPSEGPTVLILEPATAALISPGATLLLEEIFINFRETVVWPVEQSQPEPTAAPAPTEDTEVSRVASETIISEEVVVTPLPRPKARYTGLLAMALLGVALGAGAVALLRPVKLPEPAKPPTIAEHASANNGSATDLSAARDRTAELQAARDKAVAHASELSEQLQEQRSAALKPPELISALATIAELKQQIAQLSQQMKSADAAKQPAVSAAASVNSGSASDLAAARGQITGLEAERDRALAHASELSSQLQARDATIQTLNEEHISQSLQVQHSVADKGRELDAALSKIAELKLQVAQLNQQASKQAVDSYSAETERLDAQNKVRDLSRASWLAVTVDSDGALQTAANQTSRTLAEQLALKACDGRGDKCNLLGSLTNSCFSMARPSGAKPRRDNYGTGIDANWEAAQSLALEDCNRVTGDSQCKIRFTACSPASLDPPEKH